MDRLFNSRVLMSRPEYYGIEYSINPWMDIHQGAKWSVAQRQWLRLHHTIIRLGGFVEYVSPAGGLPDMVFTANAGLFSHSNRVVLAKFKHEERAGEERWFKMWFEDHGFDVCTIPDAADIYHEGAGDALWSYDGDKLSGTLFGGYGVRSTENSYQYIKHFVEAEKLVKLKLVDKRFYHLDTCFCPLPNGKAIYFPGAFECDRQIHENLEAHPVPENEALNFACNAVVIGNHVIIPEGCPETCDTLHTIGFEVTMLPMTEYIKSGGACKCLTLQIPLGD